MIRPQPGSYHNIIVGPDLPAAHLLRVCRDSGTHNLPLPDVDDDVKAISRNLYAEYSAI